MIRSKQLKKRQQVLVVDDQELNRDVLGAVLEEEYDVIYASDGVEALEAIRENIDSLSLVMLDIFMPNMDGFEVLSRMKADPAMENIPVIVLTADKTAELKALRLGAADFITKPFDLHEVILARAARIIELSDGRHLISTAERDKLTKLYSRNFFFEYAKRLLTNHKDMCLDAVDINIDQFHSINALNGRQFGDSVLELIGSELLSFLSGVIGIAGRLEGDKFVLYCAHQDDHHALLRRLQEKVNAFSPNVRIRLRMGVKECRPGEDPALMFDHAHAACSRAGSDHPDHDPLLIYDEEMEQRELRNQRLLNDLQAAVDEHQFVVFYQPKYNITGDVPRLSSAEALIRWRHPELGMISPGEFIPLLEGNGLIGIADEYVWRETAAQIAKWKEKFNFTLPVSVNLSRSDVFNTKLVNDLIELVPENGLEYSNIKLEVTESAYTNNAKRLLSVVEKFRDIGFEIEMDDFGSGYSSLNMLSSMPIDVLKMDMKFIRNIETNETDRRLVQLVLDIAKYLGVPVVAEGVETEGQIDILRKAGCDLVQGYYFSKPVPAEEFERFIIKEIETERN